HRHRCGGVAGALASARTGRPRRAARRRAVPAHRVGVAQHARISRWRRARLALYSRSMFDVLVFVYEHYWRGDQCPELQALERKLSAQGFEPEEIHAALVWLDGLNFAAQSVASTEESPALAASASSLRVYSPAEQEHLGAGCLGFIA